MKRQRPIDTPELMTQDSSSGSGPCPSRTPPVKARSRGSARLSISEVTDQFLPSTDSGIKSRDAKSLSKSDNLEDEVYPSPKSKSNEPGTSNTKAKRKRSKKEQSSSSPIKAGNNAKRGKYPNQKVARIGKGKTSSEIKRRKTRDKSVNIDYGGPMEKAENENSSGEINNEQIADSVDLDTSVSSVEVSADEKEEKGVIRCEWCKKKFEEKDWGKLNRHKKLSHETPCPNCDLMFVDEMDLAKHSKEYHSIGKRHNYAYECRKCLKKSQTFKSNLKHEELEHPHKCKLCIVENVNFPFSFVNEKGLEIHQKEKHKSKVIELDRMNLSNEDETLEGDESKDSVDSLESVKLLVVKPKIMKQKKVSSGSKAKSSRKAKIKSEKLQENVDLKISDEKNIPESNNKVDKHPVDYSNFIKNESIIEGSNQDNDCVPLMNTVRSNKDFKLETLESTEEIKLDYYHFIVNESLQEDGMAKEVLTNEQIEEEYNLASNDVKKEEHMNNDDDETEKVDNQSRSNAIKSSEEKHLKGAEFSIHGVKTEFKEPLDDREANEKGRDLDANVLKKASNDNVQDSEISTTSQNISEEFSEENFGVDMVIGVNSNEAKENCITDHTEDTSNNNNNQDEDRFNNQESGTPEMPLKSSPSNSVSDQDFEFKVVSKSSKETLDLPLEKDSNYDKEMPKFSQNHNERSVAPAEIRKPKKNMIILSKVNGILQINPASSKKSSLKQCKNIGRVSCDENSSKQMVEAHNNDGKVEVNKKIDGDPTHMAKQEQTISIQDFKLDSDSTLLDTNDYSENVAEVSSGHKDCQIQNESTKNEVEESLDGDPTFCPSPMPDACDEKAQVEGFQTKLSPTKSRAPGVNHFSEQNFREQSSLVSKEDPTLHDETFRNDSTIKEKFSPYANTEIIVDKSLLLKDDSVMKHEATEKESKFKIGENVTPHRSTMHKSVNGLSLISTMYLNTSSETDSPFTPQFSEDLISDSPRGRPIASSSPRHAMAESIPLKIGKLQGIQSFKDLRPTREVWKTRKPNTIPHNVENKEATTTNSILKSQECRSIDKESEVRYKSVTGGIVSPLGSEPEQEQVDEHLDEVQDELSDNDTNGSQIDVDATELNDSLDEFGLDVIDSPEKKIETYDVSNLLQLGPEYSALEPEKEKSTQLERDRSLTTIEELLESDEGDEDSPLKSGVQHDVRDPTKRRQFYEVSDKIDEKLTMKKKKELVDFSCELCERIFNRESLLKNHMSFAHHITSKDSFVCHLCQHHFKYRSHLKDHIKISHDYECERCSLRFHTRKEMERHSTDAHSDGPLQPLKCELCKVVFPWEEFLKHTELSHTHPCELQVDPEANNAPHLWFVSSSDLAWHVHRKHDGPRPEYEEKPQENNQSELDISNPESFQSKLDSNCGLSGEELDSQQTFEEYGKGIHKSSLGTNLDQYVRFSNDTKEFESVTCCLCGLEFEEVQQFEKHTRVLHPFACCHGDCQKRFTNQKNLSDHLTKDHSVTYLKVYGKETIKLTATRSIANIEMVRSVEEWIRSEGVMEHLVRVMRGELESRRHELFMDRKERANSGGPNPSKLYGLSNPAFMGDSTGERDSSIVQYLIDEVFNPHFHSSDPRLREVGINSGFTYATTVLFPEMFLHQHQVKNGFSREEAERAFMEIEVTDEEREGLEQEIREAAVSQDEEVTDDEWVDAHDLGENDYENATIIVEDND